jgi:hypothetical protein
MATREEVLTNLTKAAKQGNIRDAYRDFEELPFVDQVAISISPGIGDALAVYEIGEFGARGAKNIEEKDFLGALGNYGLSGLSAISILPLFRLFRGAKAIKAIDPVIDAPRPRKGKTGLKGPGEYQAEQAAKKTTENLPLPKVEEFKPLSLDEMIYPGTLESGIKNLGLTSKAAKFINTSNKLPVQGKLITYINELEKAGVPKGELRLLNILDEANEIHPKLLEEVGTRGSLDKITRQRLSQYIKTNQKDAISKRIVRNNKHSRQIKELGDEFANIKENTFHVRGITRKEFDHYSEAPHKDHFVFDSTSEFKLPNIPETEKITEFIGGDNFLNVARVQSDYAEEMGNLAKRNSRNQIEAIFDDAEIDVLGDSMNNNLRNFAIKIARENPQLKTANELKLKVDQKLKKGVIDGGADLPPGLQGGQTFNLDQIEANVVNTLGYNPFEAIQRVVKSAQKEFPITPYIDGKAIAALKKSLDQYNDALPEINNLSLKQADLQKKINSSELTPDSPSIVDLNKELDQIKKTRDDLIGEKVVPNIDEFGGFTLSPEELKNITGKPFTESLGKSLDEIFYELEAIKPGSPAVRQKYGPGTPGERALNYFNEIVNNDKMTFDIGNGINILKRATKIKPDRFSGYPIDPYAKGTRTNYIKLPIRSNFLKAVEEGKDGMYFDSAAKRLGKEGGKESELLQGVFREGENEIDRIIRELGLDPKDYVLKPKDIEFKGPGYKFDGTYVKIDDEIRKLVQEKGVDAFKAGGAVDDDLPDVGSIIPIGPYTKPLKPDLTYGDPVINKLKKAFNFLGDVKEFVLPTPKVTDPLSLIDYVTSSSAPVIAGKTVVKGLSKINLDGEDIDELVEWVGSSKTQGAKDRIQNLLNGNFYNKRNVSKEKNPIKNTTQKYLKENNLVDKNGNVHLYRYLNIHESKTLQPDQGLSSLTLNPNHAKEMAYKQANVKGLQLKAGEKADIFDSMDPFAGSKYETTTMYRKPVVLEYMVPAEKIDAYLPAVFNSLDDASISKYSAFNADNRFSNLIDELVEDGDEYYDAVDSIGKQYGVDNFYDALDTVKKESEALVDLTNIKPKNIYTESLEIDQIANNPLIEKLEFNTGGPVSIESMLAAL